MVLELEDHDYDRLVVEVENPEETLRNLRTFLDGNDPDSEPKREIPEPEQTGD